MCGAYTMRTFAHRVSGCPRTTSCRSWREMQGMRCPRVRIEERTYTVFLLETDFCRMSCRVSSACNMGTPLTLVESFQRKVHRLEHAGLSSEFWRWQTMPIRCQVRGREMAVALSALDVRGLVSDRWSKCGCRHCCGVS